MAQSSLPYSLAHKIMQTWTEGPVAQGSEPDIYSVYENRGVVYNTRYTLFTVAGQGSYIPVKMADGQTLAAGIPLKNNGSGEAVEATVAGEAYFGYLVDAVSATSDDYAEVIVAPGNLV